jgi:(p)ppGpp synthase/HD superfamily hydrolase
MADHPNLIIAAAMKAIELHHGQTRRYNGRPYIEHPMRVAGYVTLMPGVTAIEIAAAWLHDTLEDCDVTEKQLYEEFPIDVVNLVKDLTNPSKGHKGLPRERRKAMDREHLAGVSRWAKIIKLIDRMDNVRDMSGAEPDFKWLYATETRRLILAILQGSREDTIIQGLVAELGLAVEKLTEGVP